MHKPIFRINFNLNFPQNYIHTLIVQTIHHQDPNPDIIQESVHSTSSTTHQIPRSSTSASTFPRIPKLSLFLLLLFLP